MLQTSGDVRWSTLVKLCGRPWVIQAGDESEEGCRVTIFHGDGSRKDERDWGECRRGFCNVMERIVFPVPVPEEHRSKRIVGINYDDIITETELKSGFLPVSGLTLRQLIGYAKQFKLTDFELLCAGAEVNCLSFQQGMVSIDDSSRDSIMDDEE